MKSSKEKKIYAILQRILREKELEEKYVVYDGNNYTVSSAISTFVSGCKGKAGSLFISLNYEKIVDKAWDRLLDYKKELLVDCPKVNLNKMSFDFIIPTEEKVYFIEYIGEAHDEFETSKDEAKTTLKLLIKEEVVNLVNSISKQTVEMITSTNEYSLCEEIENNIFV